MTQKVYSLKNLTDYQLKELLTRFGFKFVKSDLIGRSLIKHDEWVLTFRKPNDCASKLL